MREMVMKSCVYGVFCLKTAILDDADGASGDSGMHWADVQTGLS